MVLFFCYYEFLKYFRIIIIVLYFNIIEVVVVIILCEVLGEY